jgi:hypothetical protein
MLLGISLENYDQTLSRVSREFDETPHESFDAIGALGPDVLAYVIANFGEDYVFDMAISYLPFAVFERLTFDQAAKIRYSAGRNFDSKIENAFDADPSHELLRKIKSSIWRWSMGDKSWNEIVDAYAAIRSFDLGLENFTVTLDHTSGYNELGMGKHSRTPLDGVFAYLVHYKGEHVMTIGFSVINGRQILLQQVQLKNRSGNRWLFRFPANRLEFIIDRFRSAFKGFRIHLVDGQSAGEKIVRAYSDSHSHVKKLKADTQSRIKRGIGDVAEQKRDLARHRAKDRELRENIRHLKGDLPRLAAFYSGIGRYQLGTPYRKNDLTHYAILAPHEQTKDIRIAA